VRRLSSAAAIALALAAAAEAPASASGHGPLFGLATPTNVAGGWAVDFGVMGRRGDAGPSSTVRTMISYGWTEDLQLSVSVPWVMASAALPAARMTGMMPGGGDIESLMAWRFHRTGTSIGSRVESTAYGGLIVPGPQSSAGLADVVSRAPGAYAGLATGFASRSQYAWAGVGYTRFEQRRGDRRQALLSYSVVWGYRPPSWRTEYPHWDWRVFAEMTGERSVALVRNFAKVSGTATHQVFLGPSMLGIYRNYAIEGGVQWPVYRHLGAQVPRESFRYAVNFSYFF
jgi:hypothetical protein